MSLFLTIVVFIDYFLLIRTGVTCLDLALLCGFPFKLYLAYIAFDSSWLDFRILASFSSRIFTFSDSASGSVSRVSMAHLKFSKVSSKLYKSMIVRRSPFISTFMTLSLSTISKKRDKCSLTSPYQVTFLK